MRGYLVLQWAPGNNDADTAVHRIKALIGRDGGDIRVDAPGVLIAGARDRVRPIGSGTYVVGDLFAGAARPATPPRLDTTDVAGFRAYCQTLLSQCWGSYVAMRHAPDEDAPLCVLPEPMGMRDCTSWVHEGVRFVTCDPDRWILKFPPCDLAIDRDAVAHLLAYTTGIAEAQPLVGLELLDPGALTTFRPKGHDSERLWTPRDFCQSHGQASEPAALALRVDACLAAWATIGDKALLELSGGLDSAIVASSATRAGIPIAQAVTFFGDTLSGDERRFSRAIAAHLGIETQEIGLIARALETVMPSQSATGIRPGIGATSLFHDDRLAQVGDALGTDMLLTGQGGDALFFQHPTPAVASDPWPRAKHKSRASLEALARWSQSSIWSIAVHAWLPGWTRRQAEAKPCSFTRFEGPPRPLRWTGPLEGLPPAKAMQVLAIAGDRSAFGPSQCNQSMRVIHPLLSQPLVEYALGQSVMTLTDGRRDRALARAAFAHRLPAAIIDRRGKGALSGFFGRVLARRTKLLRSELLDGALAQADLLNRAALEQALDPEFLMQEDCYGPILNLLIVEGWMRTWQDRLRHGPA
ncbi:asparagine synthase C-terminal domain-containing protein [Sphingobium sp. CECT 9361]|uniref:asparagine synthase-related protein n=1 Tax=Sphingobium sp. CECT 9361 TaxID=2845384 RepID=UPI001E33F108|nr:asparagine synthase C-terminal domain-containing protein [Sphingobium sp. CECT 9361]CAH0356640.1 hypothetical protein SPH9361_04282 [Sphingobium sp. CECT 9361]